MKTKELLESIINDRYSETIKTIKDDFQIILSSIRSHGVSVKPTRLSRLEFDSAEIINGVLYLELGNLTQVELVKLQQHYLEEGITLSFEQAYLIHLDLPRFMEVRPANYASKNIKEPIKNKFIVGLSIRNFKEQPNHGYTVRFSNT